MRVSKHDRDELEIYVRERRAGSAKSQLGRTFFIAFLVSSCLNIPLLFLAKEAVSIVTLACKRESPHVDCTWTERSLFSKTPSDESRYPQVTRADIETRASDSYNGNSYVTSCLIFVAEDRNYERRIFNLAPIQTRALRRNLQSFIESERSELRVAQLSQHGAAVIGLFLVIISGYGLAFWLYRTAIYMTKLSLDRRARTLVLEERSWAGEKVRKIPFTEIAAVREKEIVPEDSDNLYRTELVLRDDSVIPLVGRDCTVREENQKVITLLRDFIANLPSVLDN